MSLAEDVATIWVLISANSLTSIEDLTHCSPIRQSNSVRIITLIRLASLTSNFHVTYRSGTVRYCFQGAPQDWCPGWPTRYHREDLHGELAQHAFPRCQSEYFERYQRSLFLIRRSLDSWQTMSCTCCAPFEVAWMDQSYTIMNWSQPTYPTHFQSHYPSQFQPLGGCHARRKAELEGYVLRRDEHFRQIEWKSC